MSGIWVRSGLPCAGEMEGGRWARPRRTLEIHEQLCLCPILGRGARRYRNIEIPGRIIAADLLLNVQNVLPLQGFRQPQVKADHVSSDVDTGV